VLRPAGAGRDDDCASREIASGDELETTRQSLRRAVRVQEPLFLGLFSVENNGNDEAH